MMINPLNPLDRIRKISEKSKVEPSDKSDFSAKSDSVEISNEGKKRLEIDKAFSIAQSTPEVRLEKINQIKQLIAEGKFDQTYLKTEVLDQVAEKIADSFLGR